MQGTESEIEELLTVEREAGAGFESGGVAGVGGSGGESGAERSRVVGDPAGGIERLARPAAVAEHIEAAVPVGGEIDFDVDLGLRHEKHVAVLGRGGGGRNQGRGDDGELEAGQA